MDQLMHAAFPGGGFPGFGVAEPWAPLADAEDTEEGKAQRIEITG